MTTPCLVLGATGYVGGEFLRLIAGHPELTLQAAVARSNAGEPVADQFEHLATSYSTETFVEYDVAIDELPEGPVAVFSALPHAQAALQLAPLIARPGTHVVDASADFRFADADAFSAIYGQSHPVPEMIDRFARGVPEFTDASDHQHASQPGCFATAMQLALVPAMALGWSDGRFFANGVTGATGAGKTPIATTHMPERHANLFAYKALSHRHAPEVVSQVAAAVGVTPTLHFVPHAGPFARGIHMTVMTTATTASKGAALTAALSDFYRSHPFVTVSAPAPRLKQVVGSNHARISVARDEQTICITVVIDNLLKGAAGGAMQWMNRLNGWPESLGLDTAAVGWS
ncbi:MAG: N-acetyl-gamma-glutamyl-phosphate reductase [Pseudomonadota bacterium]